MAFQSTYQSILHAINNGVNMNHIMNATVGQTQDDTVLPPDIYYTVQQIDFAKDAIEQLFNFTARQIPENQAPLVADIDNPHAVLRQIEMKYIYQNTYQRYMQLFMEYIMSGVWQSNDLIVE
jgi:hypothetical protein